MLDKRMMRTWAEIDLDALAHNYQSLRAMLPEGCKFLGMVKANAYGHGAVEVAGKLQELGADMLAVACLAEAEELRAAGVTMPILCLGKTPVEFVGDLLANRVTQTVGDLETAEQLSAAALALGGQLDIHVKLDTGMSRLGFLWTRLGSHTAVLDQIQRVCELPGLNPRGMFTHFANADGSEEYTMDQLTRYLDARDALKKRGVRFQTYHCGASAALLNYPCTSMDMGRPGLALYGYYPAPDEELGGPELRPVMTVKSRVAAVRELPAGTAVSYGSTVTLERDSRVAVLPIGYGDGYPRGLSGCGFVKLDGVRCPILGRICMDMCMVDVTDADDVQAGDIAVVYDANLTMEAAERTDTIVYEILCDVGRRIPRICMEGGKPVN